MRQICWEPIQVGGKLGYLKYIPLLGSILKFPRVSLPIPLHDIDTLARQKPCWLVLIEPYANVLDSNASRNLTQHGFWPTRNTPSPTSTILIYLEPNQKHLFGGLRPSTRTKVNKAGRLGITVTESEDVRMFSNLWSDAAKRRGVWTGAEKEILALWQAFRPSKKAILLLAYIPRDRQDKETGLVCNYESIHNNKWANIAAGVFIVYGPSSAHYMFAFTTPAGRRYPAAHLLVWKAILRAKRDKKTLFDFEGSYRDASETPDSWKGFTFFKQGFGGQEAVFLGGFAKTYRFAGFPGIQHFLRSCLV